MQSRTESGGNVAAKVLKARNRSQQLHLRICLNSSLVKRWISLNTQVSRKMSQMSPTQREKSRALDLQQMESRRNARDDQVQTLAEIQSSLIAHERLQTILDQVRRHCLHQRTLKRGARRTLPKHRLLLEVLFLRRLPTFNKHHCLL